MQLTFPLRGKQFDDTLSEIASTAANLRPIFSVTGDLIGGWKVYEDRRLSMRGLKMNSLFIPPSTDGCVS